MAIDVKDASGATRSINTMPALGQAAAAGSLPTVLASDDPLVEAVGTRLDAEATADGSVVGILKRLRTLLAGTLSVVSTAGEAHIGQVGGRTVVVGGSFSRPADTTAYASGDLVANSATAGSVVAIPVTAARINGGSARVTRARLKKSSASLTNAQFRVHLYRDDPAASTGISNGDNGAWLTKEATYLGSFDITMDRAFSDAAKGVGVPTTGPFVAFEAAAGSQLIYALIEARAGYTPASAETFTLALEIDQD